MATARQAAGLSNFNRKLDRMATAVGKLATLPKGGSKSGVRLFLGFYGCGVDLEARVVRVGYRGAGNRRPVALDLECPACRRAHRVGSLMWREVEVAEYERRVEVEVD